MSSIDRLDQATDYRRLLEIMFPGLDTKSQGDEVYMVPPSRPDEKIGEMRFSVNVKRGLWKDHKTGEQGNMLTLCKTFGPPDWRARWREAFPATVDFFGDTEAVTQYDPTAELEAFMEQAPAPAGSSMFATAARSVQPQAPAAPAVPQLDWQKQIDDDRAASSGDIIRQFAEAWHVQADTLVKAGVAGVVFQRGRLAGKPQLSFPMYGGDGKVVGVKRRGLSPIFQAGDKYLKSKNMPGGHSGIFPFPAYEKPHALICEGEKDWAITDEQFPEYEVIGNLGGASTFKAEWCALFLKYETVTVCYDNDEAGMRGCAKVAGMLRQAGVKKILCCYLPREGEKKDLWDFLAVEGGKVAVLKALAESVQDDQVVKPVAEKTKDATLVGLFQGAYDVDDNAVDAAKIVVEEALRRGVRFYQDSSGYLMAIDHKIVPVAPGCAEWNVACNDYLTGLDPHGNRGRQASSAVREIIYARAQPIPNISWCSYHNGAWYMLLDYRESRVVKVTRDSISVVTNGEDGQVFRDTGYPAIRLLGPGEYNPESGRATWDRMWKNLNCEPIWQEIASALFKACLLRPLMQTHPHIRFQGPAGSGKSTGAQLLAALATGDFRRLSGDITQAAAARIAAVRPFLLIDDVENRDMKFQPWLGKMFLRAATGSAREITNMEMGKTDDFPINSWIVTNGIHSIAEDTPALNERLFVIPMREDRPSSMFNLSEFHSVTQNRDLLWTYLFTEVQRLMPMIEAGMVEALRFQLPRESRYRLHETYAILSLVMGGETSVHPYIAEVLKGASEGERKAIVEASSLSSMFRSLPGYVGAADKPGHPNASAWRAERRIQSKYDEGVYRMECSLASLHIVFQQMRRDLGLAYYIQTENGLLQEIRAIQKVGKEYGIDCQPIGVKAVNGTRSRWWSFAIQLDRVTDTVIDGQGTLEVKAPAREPGEDEEVPF